MKRRRMILVTSALVMVATVAPASASVASDHSEIVTTFNAAAGELSEGVAVDAQGNVFVSLAPLGQLLKFAPGSSDYEVFGQVPGWEGGEGAGFLGLTVDARGNVYGAAAWTGATGVWKFDRRTGVPSLVPGTDAMGFPNSVVFDDRGNLYVTDSFSNGDADNPSGAIWRIRRNGHVEQWLEAPELSGTGEFGLATPIGANGIGYHMGQVYVANTEKVSLMTIRVNRNGTAGEIVTIAGGLDLGIPDGIALDRRGNVYVAAIGDSAVRRVNRDGSIDTIAIGAEDNLDLPSSVAFGTGPTVSTLYVVNLALIPEIGTGVGPALVAIDIGRNG